MWLLCSTRGTEDSILARTYLYLNFINKHNEEEFVAAITIGALPDGTSLDPELMPYETLAEYTDDEHHAIWAYLQTVPPVAID